MYISLKVKDNIIIFTIIFNLTKILIIINNEYRNNYFIKTEPCNTSDLRLHFIQILISRYIIIWPI